MKTKPWRRRIAVTDYARRYLGVHPGAPEILWRNDTRGTWAHARWSAVDVRDGCSVPMAMNVFLSGARNKPPRGGVLRVEKIGDEWYWTHQAG